MAASKVEVKYIDLGWSDILKELKKTKKSYTGVGYFSTGGTDPETNIAARAAKNEVGSPQDKIPPRPFMKQTSEKSKDKLPGIIKKELNLIYNGRSTVKLSLGRIGEWYVGQIKYTITNGSFTPLSPKTIARKKSSKPLIHTAEMRNNTTHREFIK